MTIKQLSVAVSLAFVCAACEGAPNAPDQPPPPAGTITLSGQVSEKTATGPVPLAGVLVTCRNCLAVNPFPRTDDQGRYSIPGIPAGLKNIEVIASKIGYVSATRPVVINGDMQINIELDPAQTFALSGVISERTPAGSVPLAGALVACGGDCRAATPSVTTDDQGRYTIAGILVESKNIKISVSKVGYVTYASPVTSRNTPIDIELDRRQAYTLSGVISEVTSSGPAGIAGVKVEFFSYVANDNWVEGSTTTDEQGRYSLPGLWSGSDVWTAIWLTKDGFRIDGQGNCDLCFRTLTMTADTELNIRLERLPAGAGVAAAIRTRGPR